MKTSIKIGLSLGMLLLLATAAAGQAVNSDSWAATDALGRKVREYKNAGDKKKDKFVGIFYLTWHMGRNDTTSQVKNITEIVRLSLGGLIRLLGPVRRLAPLDQFHRLRPVDLLGLRLTAPVLPPDRLRLVHAEIHKECLLLWRRIDVFHPREHA